MGKQLGFYAIQTRLHFVLQTARIDARKFEEVRSDSGLSFTDMVLQRDASPRLINIFDKSLRRDAMGIAQQWQRVGHTYHRFYNTLRGPVDRHARAETIAELRDVVSQDSGEDVLW